MAIKRKDLSLLHRLFGKRRPTETVSFRSEVAPEDRARVAGAIAGGRYLLFNSGADGRAVLLLNTSPKLIASISRDVSSLGRPVMMVEWLCEASANHRDYLTAGDFSACCAATSPLYGQPPFALET